MRMIDGGKCADVRTGNAVVSECRAFLMEALRRVIAGGDISHEELFKSIPEPSRLTGAKMKAYYGLSYWADDGDIRSKDSAYGPMRREGLLRLLHQLETDSPN